MSWITVGINGDADKRLLVEAISELKGVTSVEFAGDDPEYLLREIGRRLWKLEDMSSLDCPLREMRQAIEKLLGDDFRYLPKEPSEVLSGPCEWCAEHRD